MNAQIIPLNAWRGQLDIGERGERRNLTNLMLYLRHLEGLGKNIAFNELTMMPEWHGKPLTDSSIIDIRLIIEKAGFMPIDKDIRPAILRVAEENCYNPVTNYLSGLTWDKKPRLEQWLQKIMGAPDSPFVRLIGPKFLISAVARACQPGCQVDTMLVLEGEQGIKKSSVIKALFGDDHTYEIVSDFDNHRQLINSTIGAWIIELAEFVSVTRSSPGTVKGIITIRRDRVQLPYGRALTDLPRRFIFVGTINPGGSGYLNDDTGNRRYWPVTVEKANIEKLRACRDQLWAEAVHRYQDGEHWWLEGDENDLAKLETKRREDDDPWEEVLARKIKDRQQITVAEAMTELGIPYDRMDKRAQMRAAAALSKLGFSRADVRMGAKVVKIWRKTAIN